MTTPNYIKLLEVLFGPLNDIDDVFTYIKDNMLITNAEGTWLDTIYGKIIGLDRPYREQAYGTIFACKETEDDIDDPLKGFLSGGVGGYMQTLQGLKYIANPTEKIGDETYLLRLLGKGLANHVSGIITDVFNFLVTGYGQTSPVITSTAGAVNITIAEDDIMTQGDRNLVIEKGPVASGIGVSIDTWTFEYLPFSQGLLTPSRWAIDTETVDGETSKVLEVPTTGDTCYLAMDTHFDVTTTAAAYGQWDIWAKRGSGNALYLSIISTEPAAFSDANNDGYVVSINGSGTISFAEVTNGTPSPIAGYTDTFTDSVWHKVTVTRSILGSFALYLDDVLMTASSGTNPIVDTTNVTNEYWTNTVNPSSAIGLSVIDDDTKLTTWTPLA